MQEFTGQWVVEPAARPANNNQHPASILRYEISIVPKLPVPPSIVSQVVKCGLPANLDAVASRAEQVTPQFN